VVVFFECTKELVAVVVGEWRDAADGLVELGLFLGVLETDGLVE